MFEKPAELVSLCLELPEADYIRLCRCVELPQFPSQLISRDSQPYTEEIGKEASVSSLHERVIVGNRKPNLTKTSLALMHGYWPVCSW